MQALETSQYRYSSITGSRAIEMRIEKFLNVLKCLGWTLDRKSGSHYQMSNRYIPGINRTFAARAGHIQRGEMANNSRKFGISPEDLIFDGSKEKRLLSFLERSAAAFPEYRQSLTLEIDTLKSRLKPTKPTSATTQTTQTTISTQTTLVVKPTEAKPSTNTATIPALPTTPTTPNLNWSEHRKSLIAASKIGTEAFLSTTMDIIVASDYSYTFKGLQRKCLDEKIESPYRRRGTPKNYSEIINEVKQHLKLTIKPLVEAKDYRGMQREIFQICRTYQMTPTSVEDSMWREKIKPLEAPADIVKRRHYSILYPKTESKAVKTSETKIVGPIIDIPAAIPAPTLAAISVPVTPTAPVAVAKKPETDSLAPKAPPHPCFSVITCECGRTPTVVATLYTLQDARDVQTTVSAKEGKQQYHIDKNVGYHSGDDFHRARKAGIKDEAEHKLAAFLRGLSKEARDLILQNPDALQSAVRKI